jgi:hypothetical protein
MAAYDVNTIMDQARIDSQASIANYPNTLSIVHLNEIYQEVCDEIKSLNENYFKARITYDTVPLQNSYTFTAASATVLSFEKMLNVAIKYQNDNYPDFQANHAYNAGELISRSAD